MILKTSVVSTHSRPKAAGRQLWQVLRENMVSTHSRPKAAGSSEIQTTFIFKVSTHSRPKAVGLGLVLVHLLPSGFNTQPPEGGWIQASQSNRLASCFNTQPPEGGWVIKSVVFAISHTFQHTAARRRLVLGGLASRGIHKVSTHSRPKAAGRRFPREEEKSLSFNTQPPEGGWFLPVFEFLDIAGFNTQPPEGGWKPEQPSKNELSEVSTHSRPKAAGNTRRIKVIAKMFQHTAARRRLGNVDKK